MIKLPELSYLCNGELDAISLPISTHQSEMNISSSNSWLLLQLFCNDGDAKTLLKFAFDRGKYE